jgi:hypothetical protein
MFASRVSGCSAMDTTTFKTISILLDVHPFTSSIKETVDGNGFATNYNIINIEMTESNNGPEDLKTPETQLPDGYKTLKNALYTRLVWMYICIYLS